jgi:threonine/homoserine/homoserine lactone efflux protein
MIMLVTLFVKGFMLGLSIALTLSPLNFLIAYITLHRGRVAGFFASLGASSIDAFYGLIAGFGITTLSNFMIQQQNILPLLGGCFLSYLGIKIVLFSHAPQKTLITKNNDLLLAYLTTLLLALTNPLTILSLISIFSNMGVSQATHTYGSAMTLIGGIFAGSLLLRGLLNHILEITAQHISGQTNLMTQKVIGIIITGFGLFTFFNFFV